MNYYAPMQMYIILAIGVACYSIVVSRASLRHPSPDKDRVFFTRPVLILYLVWVPLMLYQIAFVFLEMSPDALPYHDVPNRVSQVCARLAHTLHTLIVSLFPCWIPLSFKMLMMRVGLEEE